jgi:DNA topoisomerase-1
MASQMKPALFDQTSVEILADKYMFKATGSVLKFDGFLKVYAEGKDEKDEEDEELEHKLPVLTEGEILQLNKLLPEHFTQPPALTEATLVKMPEERDRTAFDLRDNSHDDPRPRVRGEAGRQVFAHRTGLRHQ